MKPESSKPKKSSQKELTIVQICDQLKGLCPEGSFRWLAAECGVLQTGRKETVAGRVTWFFPPGSAELLRQHIERKRSERAATNGKQA